MRKTYLVDISDLGKTWERMEKRTRYEIRRFHKTGKDILRDNDVSRLDYFHRCSRPDRKIDFKYIQNVFIERDCIIYRTDSAAAMFSSEGNTAYYLLAGRDKSVSDGSPSAILWQAMNDFHDNGIERMDLCGANKPNIILFKKGFGGELVEQEKVCLNY